MPPTRRSSSGRNAASGNKQSTLSFNHRVTKSGAVPAGSKPVKQSPLSKHVSSAVIATPEPEPEVEDIQVEEPEQQEEAQEEPEKSEAELRAQKVSDRQIDSYWRELERSRSAKRVHQEGLSLAEKVLRYWDVSTQFGPCVGMTRMKRWQRAERLGLKPPVEVLAVLMKEEEKGTQGIERAHIDEILNFSGVGS